MYYRKRIKTKDAKTPTDYDVLGGRGGRTFSHPGNENYRQIIFQNKVKVKSVWLKRFNCPSYNRYFKLFQERYVLCRKKDKVEVSREIVNSLKNRNPPSRFLEYNLETNQWEELPNDKAIAKVSQALREGQKDIRKSLEARIRQENVINNENLSKQLSNAESNDSNLSVSENTCAGYEQNKQKLPKEKHRFDFKSINRESSKLRGESATLMSSGTKSLNLFSESLCNFRTCGKIYGSPIWVPRKNEVISPVLKLTGDENADIHSSKSLLSDDFQLENQLLKSYTESPSHNNSFLACAEAMLSKKEDENMNLVESEEIEFIRQVFSED